ncbi:hypothetical protein CEB3_c27240 [Peptococcaceae bacterium CEB3]|nr:hypothetical protein CEB3_c27240 [Peptococcaceae bacterium CEB3]
MPTHILKTILGQQAETIVPRIEKYRCNSKQRCCFRFLLPDFDIGGINVNLLQFYLVHFFHPRKV